jgi:hypothetical protein
MNKDSIFACVLDEKGEKKLEETREFVSTKSRVCRNELTSLTKRIKVMHAKEVKTATVFFILQDGIGIIIVCGLSCS